METIIFSKCLLVSFYLLSCFPPENFFLNAADDKIKYSVIHTWADKLSAELELVGDYITRRQQVQASYKDANITSRYGANIAKEMANEIKYMMDTKISAVKRIIDIAENTAMSVEDGEDADVDALFKYYNAKEMIEPGEASSAIPEFDENGDAIVMMPPPEIILTPNPRFNHERVNTTLSSVHVPTNVHDRAIEVIKAIKWSEALDRTFYNNYRENPSLSWQYFGSSTGFLRQFPASKWIQDPVDLYDCRLRSWYIEAANSPKDMVILIDNSGSMTGQRKDIAKHVVGSILDTLGPNDYVNIFTFSESVEEVVPCFANGLVQANMGNVRELKLGLENMNTTGIANVSAALTKAFDLLEVYRIEQRGAYCNQAIMLVSDGVPYDYKDIFELYNWQNLPNMPVRVFTYLIGREVADVREIKWMACANQGYYVHLSTLAEVREQVLNYIPVMARPLVLWRQDHPVIWSEIYADVVDPKMTDWLWEVKECAEQKERFMSQRKNRELFHSAEEQDRRIEMKRKLNRDEFADSTDYQFMTTVSMPVYDRRENATKVANLLGVAGTDIPINDIKRLLRPFLLGVNGYAFIVTNNGYIIIHPDFRPVFQNILKPTYNNVDMVEVELTDDDCEPRDFNPHLLEIRNSIINQKTESKWLKVKYHYDGMKRVSRTRRQYFWTPIENTSYTLVVTYPAAYGVYRMEINPNEEIHREHAKGKSVSNFFNGNHNWRIHPDWLYCKYNNRSFSSPEEELLHFLKRMREPGWKWPSNRTAPPPEHVALYSNTSNGKYPPIFDKESYYCDRELMQLLVFDAKVTEWFSKNTSFFTNKDEKGYEFKQRFGITITFLATQSGLTRWQDFYSNSVDEPRPEPEFSEYNSRAIDEIWYKRAVEQHSIEPMSFVYSVPFDAGNRNDTLITASNAVFHTEGGKSAPVAVVGFQFQHSAFVTLFKNITGSCKDGPCNYTCSKDGIDCFVLDNNGYVIISPDPEHTGRFFGEIRGDIMQRLLEDFVYKEVVIYDYQAICFAGKDTTNPASILRAPFKYFYQIFTNLFNYLIFLTWQFISLPYDVYASYAFVSSEDYNYPEPTEPYDMPPSKAKEQEFDKRVLINRTRPQPCDQIISLYQLTDKKDITAYKTPFHQCERPFVVVPINGSNLIFLVIDAECPLGELLRPINTSPEVKDFYENSTLACYKGNWTIPRRRPQSCINQHHNESAIELCGKAFNVKSNFVLISLALIFTVFLKV